MTFLSKVQTGIQQKPPFILVFGVDGVGKSTFAAGAPKPIFLGPEVGSHTLNVSRFPAVETFDQAEQAVKELIEHKHEYQTLVVDSIDWLEQTLWKDICLVEGASSMAVACGGYGKAYEEAAARMQKFKDLLLRLREKMGIILICHVEIVKFNDPAAQIEYDRYQLKLHKKIAPLFREAVDAVLFCNFEVIARKVGDRTKPLGDGARVMYTERRPSHDAKNRFNLPYQLPMSWDEYTQATQAKSNESPDVLAASIRELAKDLPTDQAKQSVAKKLEEFKANAAGLLILKNKVLTILSA